MLTKERTDTIKNLFDILKQLALATLLVWFVVDHKSITNFFTDRGLSLEMLGIKETKARLQATENAAQVANLATSGNERVIQELNTQLETVKHELVTMKAQVAAAANAGTGGTSTGSDLPARPGTPAAVVLRLDSLINSVGGATEQAREQLTRSNMATTTLQRVIERNEEVLQIKPASGPASSTMNWLIVFGSDTSADAAREELHRAAAKGLTNGFVMKRDTLFHPTLRFETEAQARDKLEEARAITRYSTGAFVVSASRFCAGGVEKIENVSHCMVSK